MNIKKYLKPPPRRTLMLWTSTQFFSIGFGVSQRDTFKGDLEGYPKGGSNEQINAACRPLEYFIFEKKVIINTLGAVFFGGQTS